jgi:hypothetical protein
MDDPVLLLQLVRTLLVPKNPLIRRHLEQFAQFSFVETVSKNKKVPKKFEPLVNEYHKILTSQNPTGLPPAISVEEIYVGEILPLFFMPNDAFELWLDGTLMDKLSTDPDYERGVVKRAIERVERVLFPKKEEGSGSPVSLDREEELFEEKLMECYPDYYSVLVDLGYKNKEIPTTPQDLQPHLFAAYDRCTLRIELRLKSERFRSKKKEDVSYALDAIDKKYKDKAQPFFSAAQKGHLPDWLSAGMLSALAEQFQKNLPDTQEPRKNLERPSEGSDPLAPTTETLDGE